MPMNRDILDKQYEAMLLDLPDFATFDSIEYLCNFINMTVQELGDRSTEFFDAYRFTLAFRKKVFEDLSELPQDGQIITVENVRYRILKTEESQDKIDFRIHLQNYGSA